MRKTSAVQVPSADVMRGTTSEPTYNELGDDRRAKSAHEHAAERDDGLLRGFLGVDVGDAAARAHEVSGERGLGAAGRDAAQRARDASNAERNDFEPLRKRGREALEDDPHVVEDVGGDAPLLAFWLDDGSQLPRGQNRCV